MSSSSKGASSWRKKKDQIHFVNARPSSETEKLGIQRMVRAHVGKWISDQTRDRGPAEHPNQLIVGQNNHNHNNASHPSLPEMQSQPGLSDCEMSADSSPRVVVEDPEQGWKPFAGNCSLSSSSPEVESPAQSSPNAGTDSQRSLGRTVRSSSHRLRNRPLHVKDDSPGYDQGSDHSHGPAPGLPTMDRLHSNVWDPFHTYPSHYSPEFIRLHEGYSMSSTSHISHLCLQSSLIIHQVCRLYGRFSLPLLPAALILWPIWHGFLFH